MDSETPNLIMDIEIEQESSGICYCNSENFDPHVLTCIVCKKQFHRSCLKSGLPSELAGDVYFKFSCENCTLTGKEEIERVKLQWTLVIILALYNLQLQGGGKYGFFRWREHVCQFIDKHWVTFFGLRKKKTATWHGTVAGTLSNGCNTFFISGVEKLGEAGWWALKEAKLPTIQEIETILAINKLNKKNKSLASSEPVVLEGPRQRKQNVVEAAVELKAKRVDIDDSLVISKKRKKAKPNKNVQLRIKLSKGYDDFTDFKSEPEYSFEDSFECSSDIASTSFASDIDVSCVKTEPTEYEDELNEEAVTTNSIKEWLKQEPEDDLELDISNIPEDEVINNSESLGCLINDILSEVTVKEKDNKKDDGAKAKKHALKKVDTSVKKIMQSDTGRKRKAIVKEENPVQNEALDVPKYNIISSYEEQKLLKELKKCHHLINEKQELCRLYRKLKVRFLQRRNGIPVFDLENENHNSINSDIKELKDFKQNTKCILDRYQTFNCHVKQSYRQMSFFTRLMGLDDDQLESVVSPYTTRILKPFIFKDYESLPLKLKLLQEIIAYSHRNDPNWKPPPRHPIDYSYVRPQHIPAINALCHEFFWPGIDLSECLQYPDFSCVALYRKVIIGFAFMVPDVKYNEAYITFIFCHPEWRRAGIASFMLYHLIQTCMGKDITLHVSATSSAVFLYQKFGFKVEELILDFYDKYLPADSKDCRHALFFRLSR